MQIFFVAIWMLAAAILIVTLLPFSRSNAWWVRIWGFPRLHILICAALGALIAATAFQFAAIVPACIFLACAIYQAARIFPFTPMATTEIPFSAPQDRRVISILSANVLMENSDRSRMRDLIEREQPEILFLMETDQIWADALSDILDGYANVLSYPKDDHYGLIFASRLPAPEMRVAFLSDDDTPTLLATIRPAGGGGFNFIGMHPRPPVPGNDTKERDEQIRTAATITATSDLPTVCMGDFNDVAWSRTARAFKRYGQYRDPRVGRGMLSSFDANHSILRFPIDQLYLTDGIDLISFDRMENVGSDHFPMRAVVALSE